MNRMCEENRSTSLAIIEVLKKGPVGSNDLKKMFGMRQDQFDSFMVNLAFDYPIYCDCDGDDTATRLKKNQLWHYLGEENED